jgi:hypothetical protein
LIPNKHGKDIAEDLSWNISSKFKPLVEQEHTSGANEFTPKFVGFELLNL